MILAMGKYAGPVAHCTVPDLVVEPIVNLRSKSVRASNFLWLSLEQSFAEWLSLGFSRLYWT